MRIDKFLSLLKYTTRSQVKNFLFDHEVICDHKRIIQPNIQIDLSKEVYIDQELVYYKDPIHLAINKPDGYLSATKDQMHPCVVDLLNPPYNRFDFKIAGRLDIDTSGLLILSTDGMFVHELMHPKKHIPKTYIAILDQPCDHVNKLLKGVEIKDDKNGIYTAKALEVNMNELEVTITIDEGKYHQVKRMFQAIGCRVVKLKRISIGELYLDDLKEGEYKEIRKENIL